MLLTHLKMTPAEAWVSDKGNFLNIHTFDQVSVGKPTFEKVSLSSAVLYFLFLFHLWGCALIILLSTFNLVSLRVLMVFWFLQFDFLCCLSYPTFHYHYGIFFNAIFQYQGSIFSSFVSGSPVFYAFTLISSLYIRLLNFSCDFVNLL